MKTFQIKKKSENTADKRIKSEARKPHHDRYEKIERSKDDAEYGVRADSHPNPLERIAHAIEKVVNQTARNAARNADEENVDLVCVRHLNSL